MKEEKIIHFVGFVTQLGQQEFIDQWTPLAKTFDRGNFILQQQSEITGKYKYLSRHMLGHQDFRFSFMKNKESENFPDQKTRVIMLGGYSSGGADQNRGQANGEKVVIFSNHDQVDVEFYSQFGRYVVHEAFYESCRYNHIIELSGRATWAPELESLLKKKEGIEVAAYRACQAHSIC
jgi:hypothetical protein